MSAYVFVAVGGGSIGLLAGGVLTQALSWHWIFFVNVPIGIATLILGRFLVVENVGLGIRQGVDWLGSGPGHALLDGRHLRHRHGVERRLGLRTHPRDPRRRRPAVRRPSSSSSRGWPTRSCRCGFSKLRTLTGSSVDQRPLGHGHVLDLLHRRALPRARARVQPHQDRTGLHAGNRGHGRPCRRASRPASSTASAIKVMYPGHAPRRGRLGPARLRRARERATSRRSSSPSCCWVSGPAPRSCPCCRSGCPRSRTPTPAWAPGIVNVSQQMAAAVGLAVLSTIATNRTKALVAEGHQVDRGAGGGLSAGAAHRRRRASWSAWPWSPFLLRTDESPEEQGRPHGREHGEPRGLRAPGAVGGDGRWDRSSPLRPRDRPIRPAQARHPRPAGRAARPPEKFTTEYW